MPIQKNGLRTKFPSRAQRHRGMHSKLSRLVTRRCNDAALIRPPSHHNRLAPQLRPFEQFHRNKKRVHVDMQNRRDRIRRLLL